MEDNENINNDPDVSPTNSWVFVEKIAVNNESEPSSSDHVKNETRIQELVEDDLGGSSSCDSDGISVISETECFKNRCCEGILTNTSEEDESDNDSYNKFNETECLLSGCCAGEDYDEDLRNTNETECFLNNCCVAEENDDDDYLNNINETDCSSNGCCSDEVHDEVLPHVATSITTIDTNNNNALTFASTVAGVCIFITYFILSNYNSAPATYHESEITIDDFDEMLLWTNYDDNDTCDFNILPEINTDISNFVAPQGETIKTSKLPTNTINQNQNANKEKYANKRDKHISRNSNNVNKKMKTKTRNADNQKTQTDHLKQQENYLKKKEKYLTKREKYLKKLEIHIVTMETRFRKFIDKMNKIHERFEDKSTKIKKSKTNTTRAGGGEWYEKMSFGRSEIRHREKLSDWMFERSKMRNKLRDKAHWYFNRANGREDIRSSENNLRSGKRNQFKTYRY